MKRAGFKVLPDRGGWLRTTLWPINRKNEAGFGPMDIFMLMGLVLGTIAVARVLIAH